MKYLYVTRNIHFWKNTKFNQRINIYFHYYYVYIFFWIIDAQKKYEVWKVVLPTMMQFISGYAAKSYCNDFLRSCATFICTRYEDLFVIWRIMMADCIIILWEFAVDKIWSIGRKIWCDERKLSLLINAYGIINGEWRKQHVFFHL